jgi:hypothetical protein
VAATGIASAIERQRDSGLNAATPSRCNENVRIVPPPDAAKPASYQEETRIGAELRRARLSGG